MSFNSLSLLIRIVGPLVASVFAYVLWSYFRARHSCQGKENALLVTIYVASRLALWAIFAVYMQDRVIGSDPRLFYKPQLEHFLAGNIPIRDFYYPYGPLLLPSMLPFYLLLGRTLAGISLFAIVAEAVALFFFVRCSTLLNRGSELGDAWTKEAVALYLINPATLYWTVFQGYHSILQTAYSMVALYFLLRGRYTAGYAVGLYSLAGTKLLAILDWPALLAACRPRLAKLLWGAVPMLITYGIYQVITGDIFFPVRYHIGYASEGNVWYLTTLFVDLQSFYSAFPGSLLPVLFFGIFFIIGFVKWLRCLRSGLTSFSFQSAMGITTFTMSLFFLFSLYTGNYYIPMLMLPASVVVTRPASQSRYAVCPLLLISALCVAADTIWSSLLGQPAALVNVFSSGSFREHLLISLWIISIVVRMACFGRLAQLGLYLALNPCSNQIVDAATDSSNLQTSIGTNFAS